MKTELRATEQLAGTRQGRLTLVKYVGRTKVIGNKYPTYEAECDCGRRLEIFWRGKVNTVISCGCAKQDNIQRQKIGWKISERSAKKLS